MRGPPKSTVIDIRRRRVLQNGEEEEWFIACPVIVCCECNRRPSECVYLVDLEDLLKNRGEHLCQKCGARFEDLTFDDVTLMGDVLNGLERLLANPPPITEYRHGATLNQMGRNYFVLEPNYNVSMAPIGLYYTLKEFPPPPPRPLT